jgi:two-component system, OmpR family, sensor kinase
MITLLQRRAAAVLVNWQRGATRILPQQLVQWWSMRPIRQRLTLWYTLLMGTALLGFALLLYILLWQLGQLAIDRDLTGRASLIRSVMTSNAGSPSMTDVAVLGERDPDVHFIRVWDSEGKLLFDDSPKGRNVPLPSVVDADAIPKQGMFETLPWRDTKVRSLTQPIYVNDRRVGLLQVTVTFKPQEETLRELLLLFVIVIPLLLLFVGGGGWLLARYMLQPIRQITRTANKISARNLHQRLNLTLPDDEVGQMARTFDTMLARIEHALKAQRHFTADASHELRTPLTIMRSQIELALSRERSAESYRTTLQSIGEEVVRVQRLVNNLLLLARADANALPLVRQPVALHDLVERVADYMQPLAGERGVVVRYDIGTPLTICGDEDRLIQMLVNLLDNAARHTPPDGTITVSLQQARGNHAASAQSQALLKVSDTGCGIAPEHLTHLFDRFYRAGSDRARVGGAGLGLAICRWIAQSHGGDIKVSSVVNAGSVFTIVLPLPDQQAPLNCPGSARS